MLKCFSFVTSVERMKRQFGFQIATEFTELQNSYNITPGQSAYVLTADSPHLQIFRWGFVPHGAKDSEQGLAYARAAGLATSFSFRMSIRQKRCLVFADSYYTWTKQAAHAHRLLYKEASVMVFAGLWDEWTNSHTGQKLRSFALVKVPASEELKTFDAEMPALLLEPEARRLWLDPSTPLGQVLDLLRPLPPDVLNYYSVSPDVQDPTCNHSDLHRPYSLE